MTSVAMLILSAYLLTPEITISQGIIESNLNPLAIGDNGASKGAFQVQKKYWGAVPKCLYLQAKQSENILHSLKGSFEEKIQQYNGSGHKAVLYKNKVRKQAIELALL